ncbi:murein DD-endopeptidase MepM/ murein hydrolase activator NlpD [Orenia marismortui]|uniref:Murein DD-endopeptidase MepM/ murein hydrolase activator NlpD n=1 Tax=Orenia marismortui TaxID=46469 RepID=A0A4R8GW80_9FIRM|nr:murein DD-endopeptidase MepM/ murein hydrolase activator NlpD [Orenia marismortui]
MVKNNRIYLIILVIILVLMITNNIVLADDFITNKPTIKRVQYNLLILGYDIALTSKLDSKTYESLVDFQNKNKLKITGKVDQETFFKLEELVNFKSYLVESGDTLESIAKEYNLTLDLIKRVNDISSSKLNIGDEIIIPQNNLGELESYNLNKIINYRIKPTDNLYQVAEKFKINIEVLKKINNISYKNITKIKILRIPIRITESKFNSNKFTKSDILNRLVAPVKIKVSSEFGYRKHPIYKKRILHKGLDLVVAKGTKVKAIQKGIILYSGWIRGYGKTLTIDHGNGIVSLYAHNSKLLVSKGDKILAGEVISLSGNSGRSTGPHLHLGIYINNKAVDPLQYLR